MNYLHIAWDGIGGPERQSDRQRWSGWRATRSPAGLGTVPIDHTVLGATFEDQVTPVDPATAAFRDDTGATDALTVGERCLQGVLPRLPVRGLRQAADKATLVGNTLSWFATP